MTFERKARTILDHLGTTAENYAGHCVVRTGTATDLRFLPDNSVDLILRILRLVPIFTTVR